MALDRWTSARGVALPPATRAFLTILHKYQLFYVTLHLGIGYLVSGTFGCRTAHATGLAQHAGQEPLESTPSIARRRLSQLRIFIYPQPESVVHRIVDVDVVVDPN